MKLKKATVKVVASILALGVVGVALATHYGQYFCNNGCTLQGPKPDGETVAFIASVVNGDVSRWKNGDTVEICNTSTCVTFKMVSVFGGLEGGLQEVARRARPSGGGGGGGGAGTGGGWGPPKGGPGGGEGTVIVGDVEKKD